MLYVLHKNTKTKKYMYIIYMNNVKGMICFVNRKSDNKYEKDILFIEVSSKQLRSNNGGCVL